MTASEALIQYKGRDVSEKLFQADKSFLGSGCMRIHSSKALSAKLFVEFVALIIRNRMYNLLRETMLRLQAKANYMNVPKAIRELEKIEMVRRNNGQYRLDHAISKKQKIILSSFGLADTDVFTSAAEISMLLKSNQALPNTDKGETDNDYMEDSIYGEEEIDICD